VEIYCHTKKEERRNEKKRVPLSLSNPDVLLLLLGGYLPKLLAFVENNLHCKQVMSL
jgi:hypothetical protein